MASTRIEFAGELEVNGPPTENDHEKLVEIGKELMKKVEGNGHKSSREQEML